MSSILEEAKEAVHQRGGSYGPPKPLFNAIAKASALYLELAGGLPVLEGHDGAYHYANIMSLTKVFRGALGYKRDNEVDKAGYAWCAEQCAAPMKFEYPNLLNEALEHGA